MTPLLSTGLYPDGNSPAHAWQIEALQVIDNKILMVGAATLSAAPKAGKTIFVGEPWPIMGHHIREDDIIVVWKLDRLARSTRDLLETMETIREA